MKKGEVWRATLGGPIGSESGLLKESVVNISQVLTLDKTFLAKNSGKLTPKKLGTLNEGLRLVLSI